MATQQMTPDQARMILANSFGSYGAAATGNAPSYLPPEQFHEQAHQQMTADQARAAIPSSYPIAYGTPDDPLASAAMATQVAQGAQQGVATDAAQQGSVAPAQRQGEDTLRAFLNEQVTQSQNEENQATQGLDTAIQQQGQGIDTATEGEQRKLAAQAAEQQAEQPYLREQTEAAANFERQQQQVLEAGQKAYNAQMIRVRAAMNEAASAEVKNFWGDSSTGAKVLGVIAQALSGAASGLAGNPGAVTPLDRLIEQDMQRQEYNSQQKNKAAYREQGMLSLIQKQTGDRLAAANAMKLAAWDRVSRQVAELKNTMGGPVAEAQAQQLQGLADERKGMYQEKLQHIMLEKAQQDKASALRSIGTLDATQAAIQKQRYTAQQNHFSVIGLQDDGSINKSQFDKIAPASEAYAKYITAISGMKSIAAKGLTSNPIAAERLYDQYKGQALAAVRVMDNTGAAVSDKEYNALLPRIPSFYDVTAPGLSELRGGVSQLDTALDTVTDGYVGSLQALGIRSQLNSSDPVAGAAITRYLQRQQGAAR